jgi:hypothetical protein
MTQTITRMYGSHDDAMDAVNELKKSNFPGGSIHVVSPADVTATSAGPGGEDPVTAAIMKGYVLKAHAKIYAEGVRNGGTLVTVHAPFGSAGEAIEILDNHHPIESGVAEPQRSYLEWDDAAPVSSMFLLPVLSKDRTPFSSFWNMPTRKHGRTIKLKQIAHGTLSSSLGLPHLSRNPAPLSSLFGLPLLSKQTAKRRAK